MTKLTIKTYVHYIILAAVLYLIFVFRFPSLFEPFWYGDEGIFAAVASNLNQGGVLYQTSWDNKPPMIYLTYAAIFKYLGVSMFSLRLVTIIVVLVCATVIYTFAEGAFGRKRALVATFLFGLITSLRLIEGNLALTEIFMILPISFAMLIAIKRKFDYLSLFLAGFLFAVASLYKQVGAFEAAALGIYLFLIDKNLMSFIKKSAVLSIGFVIPYLVTVVYFAPKGLLGDYIFGAYTYYRIYFGESPRYALLTNIGKFTPIAAACFYGLFKKLKNEKIDTLHLILLWGAFSFLGSYFSGRTYGHYLVQAVPAVSLLLASISWPKNLRRVQIAFALLFFIPIILLTKVLFSNFLTAGPINQVKYFSNFRQFATGQKELDQYWAYFDRDVITIMALSDFFETQHAHGASAYIWGDMSWLYAIEDLKNPSRYVTSFHVFGVPGGREEVAEQLYSMPPQYIVKGERAIGRFSELEKLLVGRYTLVSSIEGAQVFVLAR